MRARESRPDICRSRTKAIICQLFLTALIFVTFMVLSPSELFGFRLFTGPPATPPNSYGGLLNVARPTDQPPFVHWDLREFPTSLVPYTINQTATVDNVDSNTATGVAQDRQLAYDAVKRAFDAWADVTPSIIGFVRTPNPTTVTNQAIRKDNVNVVSWTFDRGDDTYADLRGTNVGGDINIITSGANRIIATSPQGDDTWTIPGSNPGDLTAAPYTFIVRSGADNTINTSPIGDDTFAPINIGANRPYILAGANGWLETMPQGDDVFDPTTNRIDSGPNGLIETQPNNTGPLGSTTPGMTGIFYNKTTGVISEADILLNDDDLEWRDGRQDLIEPGDTNIADIEAIVIHEAGHFIGIAHPDDMQTIPIGYGEPNTEIIEAGADFTLETTQIGGDDWVDPPFSVMSGPNGISESTAAATDDQIVANGRGAPDTVVLNWGEDEERNTTVGGDDTWVNDGTVINPEWVIRSGPNGIAESGYQKEDLPTMNQMPPFQQYIDAGRTERYSLEAEDIRAANFLYTPDHGDAPDDANWGNQRYPSYIREPTITRSLNAIQLVKPAQGATHVFGYIGSGDAYEWLAKPSPGKLDNPADEDAKVATTDDSDDGVEISGVLARYGTLKVKVYVHLKNRGQHTGNRYLNAWFDWDGDRVWEDEEWVIGRGVGQQLIAFTQNDSETTTSIEVNLTVPVTYPVTHGQERAQVWARFRIDWLEDVGQVGKTDPQLAGTRYLAQFGEVEDYVLPDDFPGLEGGQPRVTWPPSVESADPAGNAKNRFMEGEPIHAIGEGYAVSTDSPVYVVEDQLWRGGETIPARVAGTETTVTSNASGNLPNPLIWSSGRRGYYDIIVDVNRNGVYDVAVDAIDDFDIDVGTAGFRVTRPSLSFWGMVLLVLSGMATGFLRKKAQH